MQATTTTAVHDALVTAIRGITPRYAYQSAQTWHHTPQARDEEIEGAALRNFYLECGPTTFSDVLFTTGMPQEFTLEVHTSYRDVPSEHLDHMANQDGFDLWTTFEGIYDPTTPGLFSVERDNRFTYEREDGERVVAHVFSVVYNQQLQ